MMCTPAQAGEDNVMLPGDGKLKSNDVDAPLGD